MLTNLSVGAGAMGLGLGLLKLWPVIEEILFIGGAARVASLLSGAAAVRIEDGWGMEIAGQPVLVTAACSATDFFLMTTAVLGWHLASRIRWPLALVSAVVVAVPLTIFVNALRVVAVAQAHRWVIPRLPEAYDSFLHMLTGAAVFLPALIVINLVLETYGNAPAPNSRA